MPDTYLVLIFAVGAIVSAVCALEIKDTSRSIIALWVSAVFVGAIFMLFSAYYASVLQWLVYAGALVILFLTFIAIDKEEEVIIIEKTDAIKSLSNTDELSERTIINFQDVSSKGGND